MTQSKSGDEIFIYGVSRTKVYSGNLSTSLKQEKSLEQTLIFSFIYIFGISYVQTTKSYFYSICSKINYYYLVNHFKNGVIL